MAIVRTSQPRAPWNKGKLVGQKAPLKLMEIWAIRVRLQLNHKVRDLALFHLDLGVVSCFLHGSSVNPTVRFTSKAALKPAKAQSISGALLIIWAVVDG